MITHLNRRNAVVQRIFTSLDESSFSQISVFRKGFCQKWIKKKLLVLSHKIFKKGIDYWNAFILYFIFSIDIFRLNKLVWFALL